MAKGMGLSSKTIAAAAGNLRRGPDLLDADMVLLLEASGATMLENVLLNLAEVNVGNLCVIAVKDLGDFLEGRAAGLDVEDGDEDELKEDPALG
jgi:hypothetical protein